MDVFIVVSTQQNRRSVIKITGNIMNIGRSNQCSVPIEKAAVSRLHAKITREDGRFYIEDCGSQNGTFMNSLRLTSKVLLPLYQAVNIANEATLSLTDTVANLEDVSGKQTLMTDDKPSYFLDVLQQEGGEIQRFYPVRQEMTIGRSTDNELSIPDPFISRQHLSIKEKNRTCLITLLNISSHARLVVNDRICTQHLLHEGDVIEIGRTRLVFHFHHDADDAPTVIGRYRIIERLGQGGMGVVYLGEDSFIKRKAAIKILLRSTMEGVNPSDQKDYLNRLFREAQILAQLDHPNIVRLYEADYYKDGIFIAMEYLQGHSLDVIMANRSLTLEEKVAIAKQICEGLHEIHIQKLVHRDVKPANLIMTLNGTIKIMDFGLVQVPDSKLTQSANRYLGSPSYMAPERFRDMESDHRSDIFSFGVVLYQLFTGTLPFVANSLPALIFKLIHENPVPPSQINYLLSEQWDTLIMKTLEQTPENRYASCLEIKNDLQRLMDNMQKSPEDTVLQGRMKRHKIVLFCQQFGQNEELPCQKEIVVTIDGKLVGSLTAHGILNVLTGGGPHDIHLETMERQESGQLISKGNHRFSIKHSSPVCYLGIEEKGDTLQHVIQHTPPQGYDDEVTLLDR